MALSRFVRDKFGINTVVIQNPVTDSCGTSVTQLLLNNPDRLSFILVNLGTTNLYVSWDNKPASDHGVYVAPNGGSFSVIADEDLELVGMALYGISATSANDIFIVVVEAV